MENEIERVFFAQRPALSAFLARLGAGDLAEEVLQELWIRLPKEGTSIHAPKGYLYRMAHRILIDLDRSRRQSVKREAVWLDLTSATSNDRSEEPSAERVLAGRQMVAGAFAVIEEQGERPARVFVRHRLDGLTQKQVAQEMGISRSTVEEDLRRVYRALAGFRAGLDKA